MIFLFLLISLLASPAYATTYYVATTGNDTTGDGSSGNPWLTIQKCGNSMVAGDTCRVKAGTYTITTTGRIFVTGASTPTGTAANPVTIMADSYGDVILELPDTYPGCSSGCPITGFYITKPYYTIEGFVIKRLGSTYAAPLSVSGINALSNNITIRKNWFFDIGRNVCSNHSIGMAGIFGDGASNLLIEQNRFSKIGRLRNGESGCVTTTFQHDHGIYLSSPSSTTIRRNVFYDVNRGYPIHIFKSGGQTVNGLFIYNNTIAGHNASADHTNLPSGQILLSGTLTNVQVKNNISYDPPSGHLINWFGTPVNNNVNVMYNISDSSADADLMNGTFSGVTNSNNTVGATLAFTNAGADDYTLTSSSAVINVGTDIGLAYNGAAPDMGAFETFVFASCQVPNGATSTIQITFTNNVNPPIGSTITTFTARKNGANNALTGSASIIGDSIASLPLTNSYAGGDTADISWASGSFADTARIGGTLNQPFVQTLSNQSCTNNAAGAPTYTLTQSRFEFHDKYGTEAAPVMLPYGYASSGAAENFSNLKAVVSGSVRIRFALVCGTSNCDPTGFLLYYSTGGAYGAVPDSFDSGNIKFCGAGDSSLPANGSVTTNQLSTAGTFVAGGVVLTANAIPTVTGLNTNFKTELEYCVAFDSDATGNYDFRVYKQSGTALDTYTVTPRVVIQATAAGGSGF